MKNHKDILQENQRIKQNCCSKYPIVNLPFELQCKRQNYVQLILIFVENVCCTLTRSKSKQHFFFFFFFFFCKLQRLYCKIVNKKLKIVVVKKKR